MVDENLEDDMEEENRLYTQREEFLEMKNLTEEDVMEDEFGREYIYELQEDGPKKKVYLPK